MNVQFLNVYAVLSMACIGENNLNQQNKKDIQTGTDFENTFHISFCTLRTFSN